MDVHIDTDAFVAAPRGAHAEVGHLRSYAGETDETFDGIRDFRVEFVDEDLSGGFDVAGFVVVETDGVDEFVETDGVDGQDSFEGEAWRWKFVLKASHCDSVGGVLGLRAEHEGDQGLETFVLALVRER